jgi:hypothetical protein
MITAEEVVRSLPVLLKEHPALRMELFVILSEEFVGRSEFYEYIKSYAKPDEIENFNEKAELAKKKLGLKKVVKALITLEKHPSVVKQCEKLGILVG